jgi:hypothetical protein
MEGKQSQVKMMLSTQTYSCKGLRIMPFIAKVLFLAACLSFAVVYSMEETGNFDSLRNGNRRQKKNINRRQRLLVQTSVEQCKDNLVQASSKYDFLFSKVGIS